MMKFMIGGACITDLYNLAERPYANEDLLQAWHPYFSYQGLSEKDHKETMLRQINTSIQ